MLKSFIGDTYIVQGAGAINTIGGSHSSRPYSHPSFTGIYYSRVSRIGVIQFSYMV